MRLIVNPHEIEVEKSPVNEKQINITKCEFEFADEITEEYVKEAYFTLNGNTYKKIIVNNECEIPYEVLTEKGQIEIGVVAYLVEDEEEIKRYNPRSIYIQTWSGSLKANAQNSEEITPSEMEQYEQALQDGLTEVNGKIDDIDAALTEVNNLDIDANKVGTTTTITITKKDGTSESVQILDGETGPSGRDGVDGTTPTIGDNGNWYLGTTDTGKPSRGIQGEAGQTGPAGQDGTSPTASVSKSGNTATITITDKNGTTTATVSDGTNGTNGRDGYVQYTAGNNITIENNVISATGGSSVPIYVLNTTNQLRDDYGDQYLEADAKTNFANIIMDAVSKGYKNITIMACSTTYGKTYAVYSLYNIDSTRTQFEFYSDYAQSNRSEVQFVCYRRLKSTGSWSNGVYTCDTLMWTPNYTNLLTSSNTQSYNVSNTYTPAHKKYVDDSITAITTQYSTMPTADSTTVGKIVQYTGTTGNDYTNGYFYIGVNNSGTYGWSNINVQPSSGGGGSDYPLYVLNLGVNDEDYGFSDGYEFSSSDKQTMASVISDAYTKGFKFINMILTKDNDTQRPITFTNGVESTAWGSSIQLKPTEITWYATWLNNRFDNYNAPMLGSAQITVLLSWSGNTPTVTYGWFYTSDIMMLTMTNTVNYSVSDSYIPAHKAYVDGVANPTVTTSSTSTYTISSLEENKVYKLSEITALTITAVTTFDKESIIYFSSGSTATSISIPDTLTNLGDVPTLTTASNVSTGTCTANKSYIISVLNNIAFWKEY